MRLQWDPDHDPYGNKLTRRAVQLGLKGEVLKNFACKIKDIQDITDFVKQQKLLLDRNCLDDLLVPIETVFKISDNELNNRIGIQC